MSNTVELPAPIVEESILKIKELLLSDYTQDKVLGKDWLISLVGEDTALANVFFLNTFWTKDADWGDDWNNDILKVDDENYLHMNYKTPSSSFGKSYYYQIKFKAMFRGELIVDTWKEYSRDSVAQEIHFFQFREMAAKALRKRGVIFIQELFKN